jgi:hypothetical protein
MRVAALSRSPASVHHLVQSVSHNDVSYGETLLDDKHTRTNLGKTLHVHLLTPLCAANIHSLVNLTRQYRMKVETLDLMTSALELFLQNC